MIDRKAFHSLSYGLYIVCAKDAAGMKAGCVVNTFAQVSSDPMMVSVSLNKDNATTEAIRQSGQYNVSVLSQRATMELIGRFGFRSSKDVDKFSDSSYEVCSRGIPYIKDECVSVFCVEVREIVDVGSHEMFIGEVKEAAVFNNDIPLTYSYYHEVLKGKTPPKAVSYVATDEESMVSTHKDPKSAYAAMASTPDDVSENDTFDKVDTVADEQMGDRSCAGEVKPRYGWRCSLCGYIVELDELPDDFTCPMCGMGREYFERIEL